MSYQQAVTVYSVEERPEPNPDNYCMGWVSIEGGWMEGHRLEGGRIETADAGVFSITHFFELPGPPREACGVCQGAGARWAKSHQKCPSENCLMCSGEACAWCGAGSWGNPPSHCDHDVDRRHKSRCEPCKGTGSTPTGGQR